MAESSSHSKKFANVYQFKITLKETKPPIWRRIQVPENYNFWEFHVAIVNAMGWLDTHLHQFKIRNQRTWCVDTISMPEEATGVSSWRMDDEEEIDERKVFIKDYFLNPKDKGEHEYDFGDGWEHQIELEKIVPAIQTEEYPKCLAGRRACPPENCGGTWGYKELLKIIVDKNHPEYKDQKWNIQMNGGDWPFDPEKFDPKEVYFDDPKESWNLRVSFL